MLLGDRALHKRRQTDYKILKRSSTAFGTPWNGKEGRGENIYAPLAGICFLVRSELRDTEGRCEEDCSVFFRVAPSEGSLAKRQLLRCIGKIVDRTDVRAVLRYIRERGKTFV